MFLYEVVDNVGGRAWYAKKDEALKVAKATFKQQGKRGGVAVYKVETNEKEMGVRELACAMLNGEEEWKVGEDEAILVLGSLEEEGDDLDEEEDDDLDDEEEEEDDDDEFDDEEEDDDEFDDEEEDDDEFDDEEEDD